MKILVVEDEQKLADALKRGLELGGYTVDIVSDGKKALSRISLHRDDYDAIILDIMLPTMDGEQICKEVRAQNIAIPILILTARSETETKVNMLLSGADDYLVKPFSFAELSARLQALLRRPTESLPEVLEVEDITLNPGTRKATRDGRELPLTLKEFGLLEYFMRHPNQVVICGILIMSDSATWWTSTSKTFAESLPARRAMTFWKRCVALGTDFVRRYQFDPFFRTEVSIVVLQMAFALFLLAIVGVIATQLYHDATTAVSHGITAALSPGANPTSVGDSVISNLSAMRSRTVLVSTGVVILVTALFTYIIARLALGPTRNALKSQKQFIGNIAHELRTPLAVSKTNMEVALMAQDMKEDLRRSITSTVEELDRIAEIINNLLSLSASVRPERIEFKDVDLGVAVQSALDKLHNLAASKRIDVTVKMSERRDVWGNRTALEEIAMNILKNAISYTPAGGHITVVIQPVYPDHMELCVQDSGIGIARKDLFRIFEPFYRSDPSRKRHAGGSGLGLTIVSELVKLHNGKITVRSAEGHGTAVTVLFPAGHLQLGVDGINKRQRENVSEVAVDFSQSGPRRVS